MGNSGQTTDRGIPRSSVSSAQEMAAFDELPPDARAALRDAVLEWPAIDFLARVRRGHQPGKLIERVRAFEADMR